MLGIIETERPVSFPAQYGTAMEHLVGVVQELSQARDVEAVMAIVRQAARDLTGADGATFVLRDGDMCYYAEENAISPLWKGRRFPMNTCISGWVMLNARPAVISDIYSDPRIPADAYRPTFVKSLAMVPIRRKAPVGAIGNYWAEQRQATEEEVAILQALADTTSVALENAKLYGELKQQVCVLHEREAHIQKQRDALEVFTRALAHDLKEPVRAVQSFARLLGKEGVSEKKIQEYIPYIQDGAERMGILIESVSQYIQLDHDEQAAKSCAMNRVLATVQENLAPLIRQNKPVITSDPLPELPADPDRMLRVLQHLVANAVRYGGSGVAVHVHAEERESDWLFAVGDNGPGIPPEYIEKIFLPFKRLQNAKDNSGLGLAICRKIIEASQGKIWCESGQGKGAVFYFTLPKIVSETGATGQAQGISPGTDKGKGTALANILLVDDAESDIELARLMLEDELHCNLLVAKGGEEALETLKKSLHSETPIDLALLDINMPGMDGFELLENMLQDEKIKDIPVIMCTGSAYEKDIHRSKSFSVAGYLVKPPSFQNLNPILEGIQTLAVDQENGRNRLVRVG